MKHNRPTKFNSYAAYFSYEASKALDLPSIMHLKRVPTSKEPSMLVEDLDLKVGFVRKHRPNQTRALERATFNVEGPLQKRRLRRLPRPPLFRTTSDVAAGGPATAAYPVKYLEYDKKAGPPPLLSLHSIKKKERQ